MMHYKVFPQFTKIYHKFGRLIFQQNSLLKNKQIFSQEQKLILMTNLINNKNFSPAQNLTKDRWGE